MKLHIFVATTQGLVAIQNIVAIDDNEINSIVTVNGTSTTANISGAYHAFVKKGSGIIQHDFGGSSYRVNLSKRIDHGNSWQLAFYLAHVANEQGILGNGQVQPEDAIICATGEINTSNRVVQPVEQVSLKQSLAQEKIHQWLQYLSNVEATTIAFLVPYDNQQELAENFPIKPVLITTLADAISLLPVLAASKWSLKSTAMAKSKTVQNTKVKPSVKRSLKVLFVFVFIVLAVFGVQKTHFFEQKNTPNISAQHGVINQAVQPLPVQKTIALTATFAKYGDCNDQLINQPIQLKKQKDKTTIFNATKLVNLCSLSLTTPAQIKTVLLVAAGNHAIKWLVQHHNHWQIPLPTLQNIDRRYYLVLLTETQATQQANYQQRLQKYLQREIKSPRIKASHLQHWLDNNNWHGAIVSHTLITY